MTPRLADLVDSWAFRRWAFWLPCALRGHRPWGDVVRRLNGTPVQRITTCSCGRRITKESL